MNQTIITPKSPTLKKIRRWIICFVICLVLAGLTAFPVYSELEFYANNPVFPEKSWAHAWLMQVWTAIKAINETAPLIFYGFDWLAFAHIMIGLAFIGPYKDPIKNEWVIDWAMLCCIGVIPLAFIMGPIRDIPLKHILIDCSVGVFGILPLLRVKKLIKQLKATL
jgi:hypothetical protein